MGFFSAKKKELIKDLTEGEIIEAATQLLRKSGRNQTSFRLIYHALVLDPYEPQAIIRLSEFFDDAHVKHTPEALHMLAGLVLDYALGFDTEVALDERANLQKVRLKLLWAWGYATSKIPKKETEENIIDELSTFTLDDNGFLNTISRAAAPYGNFKNAFISAHTIIGVKSGLLIPKDPNAMLQPWHVTRANHLPAPEYAQWLSSDSEQLRRVGVNLDIYRSEKARLQW